MNIKRALLIFTPTLVLAGCASYQGGTVDDFAAGQDIGTSPMSSPSMRPGMNATDIRDPNVLTRPAPPVLPGAPAGVAPRP